VVALSVVGFDAAKTRAMVTVQYNCFPSMEPGVTRTFATKETR
jgi:hypothetical protein